MWEKIVHIFDEGLGERRSSREECKREALARTLLSQTEGIPRTPEADDRHIERMPSALREVHSKMLSTS